MGDTQGGDSWSTPGWLFDLLDNEFHFELDAAASLDNFKCFKFFTAETNALTQDWSKYGSVFCNPPYSDPMPWVKKAIEETGKDTHCVVALLLPSDTSTRWFKEAFQHAAETRLIQPRIKFGGVSGSPRWGSVLFVFETKKRWQTVVLWDVGEEKK